MSEVSDIREEGAGRMTGGEDKLPKPESGKSIYSGEKNAMMM